MLRGLGGIRSQYTTLLEGRLTVPNGIFRTRTLLYSSLAASATTVAAVFLPKNLFKDIRFLAVREIGMDSEAERVAVGDDLRTAMGIVLLVEGQNIVPIFDENRKACNRVGSRTVFNADTDCA
ncbi:hypothetical protein FB567DRAFT_598354 [Paraphoma chrysanthemicola]|uniref:Uncharacterized protein n=1 Tax=Paraphoma chrysanthemicola TaxID=798071 RepID=A0A8K0VT37_9PLEO|nr:hypothetical protein FB567DRAFT_598354 [Paraphoma chrysanthemicola]